MDRLPARYASGGGAMGSAGRMRRRRYIPDMSMDWNHSFCATLDLTSVRGGAEAPSMSSM